MHRSADHLINQFLQWNKLFGVNKIERLHKPARQSALAKDRCSTLSANHCIDSIDAVRTDTDQKED